jgi:hypothetical protein
MQVDGLVTLMQMALQSMAMVMIMLATSIYICLKCLKCYLKLERNPDGSRKRTFRASINDMSSGSTTPGSSPDSSPVREDDVDQPRTPPHSLV